MDRGRYRPISDQKISFDSVDHENTSSVDADLQAGVLSRLSSRTALITISKTQVVLIVFHLLLFMASVSFFLFSWSMTTKARAFADPDPIYSPAQHTIEYQRAFLFGPFKNSDQNMYSGPPNDANNAAWKKLVAVGIVDIDLASAASMEDPSAERKDIPGKVKTGLDVFHQLHCLYNLRKYAYPEYPWDTRGEDNEEDLEKHTGHCIDYLRQTIMCHADLSPISWRWNETTQLSQPDAHILHSCRDFSRVYDWAAEHAPHDEILPGFQEVGLEPLSKAVR